MQASIPTVDRENANGEGSLATQPPFTHPWKLLFRLALLHSTCQGALGRSIIVVFKIHLRACQL